MTNIFAFIPARGGSKGVPRKALQPLGDKPLIAHTIQDALAIQGVSKVFVSTDDPEIQAVSKAYGAEVPFLRPAELAKDDSNLEDAHRFSLNWYRENEGFVPDIQVVMSPTYPFRRPNLINEALKRAMADRSIFNIGSVAPADVSLENYWTVDDRGLNVFRVLEDGQDVPESLYQSAFSFNIIFDCRPDAPRNRIPVVLNEIEAIDIDVPRDLELARSVLRELTSERVVR